MNKEVERFLVDCGEYHYYDRADPSDVLALSALKNRMLEVRKDRAPGGILTNVYDWDFIPKALQHRAISRLFYRIGYSWGFDKATAIKLTAALCLIEISPEIKSTVVDLFKVANKTGCFAIHGLSANLR
jgi:hypothetical protein